MILIFIVNIIVRNLLFICLIMLFLKKIGKFCLEFYNMIFNEENFVGCVCIFLKIKIVFSKEILFGCFGIFLDEDSKIESIDENKIIGKID